MIYRKVTAFTHPLRVAITRRLRQGSARFSHLRRQLGIATTDQKSSIIFCGSVIGPHDVSATYNYGLGHPASLPRG